MPILNAYLGGAKVLGLAVLLLLFVTGCDKPQERWDSFVNLLDAAQSDFSSGSYQDVPPVQNEAHGSGTDANTALYAPAPIPTREVRYTAQFDRARFTNKPWVADTQAHFLPGTLLVSLASPQTKPAQGGLSGGTSQPQPLVTSADNPEDIIQSIFQTLDLDGSIHRLTDALWQIDFVKRDVSPTRQISPNLSFDCYNVRDTLDLAIITACVQDALGVSAAFTRIERDFIYQPAYRLAAPAAQIPRRQTGFSFGSDTTNPPRDLAILTAPVWADHPDLDGLDFIEADGANLANCGTPLGADGTPVARVNALNIAIMNRCGGRLSVLVKTLLKLAQAESFGELPTYAVSHVAAPISLALACPPALQIAINALADADIAFLVAAGDYGRQTQKTSPSGCENTRIVTASDMNGMLTDGANYGDNVAVLAFGGRLDSLTNSNRPDAHIVRQYAELCEALDPEDAQTTVFACYDGWAEGSGLALMEVVDSLVTSGSDRLDAWATKLPPPDTTQCQAPCETYVGTNPIENSGLCLRACGQSHLPPEGP